MQSVKKGANIFPNIKHVSDFGLKQSNDTAMKGYKYPKVKNFILLLFILPINLFGQNSTLFSKEEVLSDLKYFRELLEDAHYNKK